MIEREREAKVGFCTSFFSMKISLFTKLFELTRYDLPTKSEAIELIKRSANLKLVVDEKLNLSPQVLPKVHLARLGDSFRGEAGTHSNNGSAGRGCHVKALLASDLFLFYSLTFTVFSNN